MVVRQRRLQASMTWGFPKDRGPGGEVGGFISGPLRPRQSCVPTKIRGSEQGASAAGPRVGRPSGPPPPVGNEETYSAVYASDPLRDFGFL